MKAPREQLIDALAGLLAGLGPVTLGAAVAKAEALEKTGFKVGACQIGAYLRVAILEAAAPVVGAPPHTAAPAPAPAPAVALALTPAGRQPANPAASLAALQAEATRRMEGLTLSPADAAAMQQTIVTSLQASSWTPPTPITCGLNALSAPTSMAAPSAVRGAAGGALGTFALGGAVPNAAPAAADDLQELRPAGSEGLAAAEVLGQVAQAAKLSLDDLLEAMARERGVSTSVSFFGGARSTVGGVAAAATDFVWLLDKSRLAFEGRVTSWGEAALRLEQIVLLAARRHPERPAGGGVAEAAAAARGAAPTAVTAVGDCDPAAGAINAASSGTRQMRALLRAAQRLSPQWLGVSVPRELNKDADALSHPEQCGGVLEAARAAGMGATRVPIPPHCWASLRSAIEDMVSDPTRPSPKSRANTSE